MKSAFFDRKGARIASFSSEINANDPSVRVLPVVLAFENIVNHLSVNIGEPAIDSIVPNG